MSSNPLNAIFAPTPAPAAPIAPADNPLNQIFAQPKQAAKPVESNPLNSIFANPVAQTATPEANPLNSIFANGIAPVATQPEQPETTWQKIKDFATHPLTAWAGADLSMPEISLPAEGAEWLANYLQQHGHDTLAKGASAYAGVEQAAVDQARGMTSPLAGCGKTRKFSQRSGS